MQKGGQRAALVGGVGRRQALDVAQMVQDRQQIVGQIIGLAARQEPVEDADRDVRQQRAPATASLSIGDEEGLGRRPAPSTGATLARPVP